MTEKGVLSCPPFIWRQK